ncbi:uncharacterized protein AB9W97_011379 [Spinachia spinachia]
MAEATESQRNYEEMFPHRFSLDDKEYQQYVSRPADPPPIVEDWRSRGGGNRGRDRYQDRRGRGWGGGQGWGGDRGWRGGQHGQQNWHDRDRDWDRYGNRDRDRSGDRDSVRDGVRRSGCGGDGIGHRSGPPSYNDGYNSNYQRPQYDRY